MEAQAGGTEKTLANVCSIGSGEKPPLPERGLIVTKKDKWSYARGACLSEQVCYKTSGDFESPVGTGVWGVAPRYATVCKQGGMGMLQVCYSTINRETQC